MKLKSRLFLTFLSLTVVPILLTLIAIFTISYFNIRDIEQSYHVKSKGLEIIVNPVRYFSRLTDEAYDKLNHVAKTEPQKLADITYLEEMNQELIENDSFLLVEKNSTIVFGGDNQVTNQEKSSDSQERKEYYIFNSGIEKTLYEDGRMLTFTRGISFQYPNGEVGNIFIITHLSDKLISIRKMAVIFTNTLIIILLLSIAIITINLYKSIAIPISQIKDATQNIKEGNLDFEIDVKAVKEIRELANDFNEMRSRLKLQAEEKVKYDSESKELISNISHDLKTPITAVKGYVEGIIDGVADTPEKMEKYIKTIYNKANEMDRLINELTFYSKIDTNRIPYTFTKLNVANYFSDCIEEVGFDLESKNMEIAFFDYTPAGTQIIADAEQLKRVINNIVGNSIKYLDKPKGFINIRIKDDGDFIQVEIEDNGKGIGENELPYIFDRFYRTDTSRNSAKGGSGIGLSIVKKIIEDHGGEIWATSKEFTGTVMYFKLRKYQEVQIYE